MLDFGVLYQGKADEFYSPEEIEFIKADRSSVLLPIAKDLSPTWWMYSFCEEIIFLSLDELFSLPLLAVDNVDGKVSEILRVISDAIYEEPRDDGS